MPNKKGSRVAASQARAKAAAKKKARSSGPDLSAIASRPAPVDTAESTENVAPEAVAVAESDVELNAAEESVSITPATVATAPAVRRTRAASRRERQAMTVVAAGSLRWELTMIGSATAAMGIGLVVLKLATDLGR